MAAQLVHPAGSWASAGMLNAGSCKEPQSGKVKSGMVGKVMAGQVAGWPELVATTV
jgi:hypothetical protein